MLFLFYNSSMVVPDFYKISHNTVMIYNVRNQSMIEKSEKKDLFNAFFQYSQS